MIFIVLRKATIRNLFAAVVLKKNYQLIFKILSEPAQSQHSTIEKTH